MGVKDNPCYTFLPRNAAAAGPGRRRLGHRRTRTAPRLIPANTTQAITHTVHANNSILLEQYTKQ